MQKTKTLKFKWCTFSLIFVTLYFITGAAGCGKNLHGFFPPRLEPQQ